MLASAPMWPFLAALPAALLLLPSAAHSAPWAAWMPASLSSLSGTCLSIPCRFSYPDELRPSSIHGLWYFGSPYPKHYPPVVARSRQGSAVHESFEGKAALVGDPNYRDCSLLLDPVGEEMEGLYYFRGDLGGYNQYSFAEHVSIRVMEEPTLELPPSLLADHWTELRCRIPDNCPRLRPRLSWDGIQELPDQSQRESRSDDADDASLVALLRFRPRRHDAGRLLRCRAAFANSSLTYEAAVALDVHYPPQVLSLQGPTEAVEGSALMLTCEAEGHPPPLLSWFRGPALLKEEAGVERLHLDLPHISPDDAGTYVCVAENRHGSHNRSLELHVAFPPRPPWLNGSLWAVAGQPLSLSCGARSRPLPIVTVTRGRLLVAAARYEPSVTWALPQARPEDGGEYECRAENGHGYSSVSFNVTVEYPPELLPSSHCAPGGDGARCLCSARAVPPAAVAFELPWRNLTVTEGHRDFRSAPPPPSAPSGAVAAILSLRGALDPRLDVVCRAHNVHGSARLLLRFRHPGGLVWAKVGPVGAVVAFAIVIALVCYLSQSRRKKAAGSPEVTPVQGAEPEPEQRPLQARWLRGAVGRWALGVGEGPGAPPDPAPPPKPSRDPPEDPPEYAEIRVK